MNKIPVHIGLIPDGNRRWAKSHHLPKFFDFAKWSKEAGVKVLTVFAFSTENWKRPKSEVDYLMDLFCHYFGQKSKYLLDLQKENIKVKVIGQKENLPPKLKKNIDDLEKATANFNQFYLNIALNYGGRWDIVEAVNKIIKSRKTKKFKEVTLEEFSKHLSTAGLPDIDLLIRTGKEKRISNFLLWQLSYAEIYFVDKLWPDFTKKDFDAILNQYSKTKRRFGA